MFCEALRRIMCMVLGHRWVYTNGSFARYPIRRCTRCGLRGIDTTVRLPDWMA